VDAHYSVELSQAFVAGEEELKKLTDLLSNRIGSFEICAHCTDNVSRTFKTVKELAAYENARGKSICRISISSRSDDFKKRAEIDLSGSRWRGISLDIEARDDVVSRLRTEIKDLVDGMRPWYTVLHRVDFQSIAIFAYLLLGFVLLFVVGFNWISVNNSQQQNPSGSALAQLVAYSGIAALFIMGLVMNRVRDSLFPRAVFLIGQGKTRFQHLERIQWGVVVAFLVSFAAGVTLAIW